MLDGIVQICCCLALPLQYVMMQNKIQKKYEKGYCSLAKEKQKQNDEKLKRNQINIHCALTLFFS